MKLDKAISRRKWPIRKVAEKTGVHYVTLYRIMNGTINPSRDVMLDIADILPECSKLEDYWYEANGSDTPG